MSDDEVSQRHRMFVSTPDEIISPELNVLAQERTRLCRERDIDLSEANQIADYALTVIQERKQSVFHYQGYLNVIKARQEQLKAISNKVLRPSDFPGEHQYLETRARFNNEDLVLDIKAIEVEHCILSSRKEMARQPAGNIHVDSDRTAQKLDTLKLEKFTGTIESWLSFWKRFEERVHNNKSLTTMEKYDYLRQYSAPSVISKLRAIPLTEEFYETAVNRLKEEFGSQEKVMTHYTEKLLNIGCIHSRFDVDGLRALVQLVKSSVAALNTVGLSTDHIALFFWPVLRKATPIELYLEFKASQRSMRPTESSAISYSSTSVTSAAEGFESLVSFLSTVCDEMSGLDTEKLQLLGERQGGVDRQAARMPTVAAKSQPTKKPDAECVFRKEIEHKTEACQKEMTIEEKAAIDTGEEMLPLCKARTFSQGLQGKTVMRQVSENEPHDAAVSRRERSTANQLLYRLE